MFYPDLKRYISPSAYQTWYKSPSGFVKSYFMGERSGETAAMKAGKLIHTLIENGLLEVTHRFSIQERPIEIVLENGVAVMGIPDSCLDDGDALFPGDVLPFVDYKSGKENDWNDVDLAGDLKMKVTAWLIYQRAKNLGRNPKKVVGYIEYVPTAWNEETREIEPTGGTSVVAGTVEYPAQELEAFTAMLIKTIDAVNAAHEEWLISTDAFVNQDDVIEYAKLEEEITDREERMALLIERIHDQMKMGMKKSLSTVFGSFYYSTSKKYEYPANLTVNVAEDYFIPLEEAEKVTMAASIAKKKYETDHPPVETKEKLSFRPKRRRKQ